MKVTFYDLLGQSISYKKYALMISRDSYKILVQLDLRQTFRILK